MRIELRRVALCLAASACLGFSAAALAQSSTNAPTAARECMEGRWYGHMGWGHGWMAGGWLHSLMALVALVLLVAALIVVFRAYRHGSCPHCGAHPWARWQEQHRADGLDPTRRAMQILNERYARGEIDKAEFEERRAALLSGSAH